MVKVNLTTLALILFVFAMRQAIADPAKVVIVPLDSSTNTPTLKVKDRHGYTIGNLFQFYGDSEILIRSDNGYFTMLNWAGIAGATSSTDDIGVSWTGLNCSGHAYRQVDGRLPKELVFMATRKIGSVTPSDWIALVIPKNGEIITTVMGKSSSTLGVGCFNYDLIVNHVHHLAAILRTVYFISGV